VVRKFFRSVAGLRKGRPYTTVDQVYQAIFAPGTMPKGDGPDTVLYAGETDARYRRNSAIDFNRDGTITLGELGEFVRRRVSRDPRNALEFQSIRARLAAARGGAPPSPPGSTPGPLPGSGAPPVLATSSFSGLAALGLFVGGAYLWSKLT
jgi:hypothetical protein